MGLFVLPGVAGAALLASLLAARRMSGMAIGVVGALVLGWAELANIWTGTANGPAARSTAFAAGWTVIAVVLAHSRWPALFLAGVAGVVAGALVTRCSRRGSDRGRRGRSVRGAHARLDRTVAPQLDCAAAARHRARPLVAARRRGRYRSRTAAGAGGSERPCAGRTRPAVPWDQARLDRPARHGFGFARWDRRTQQRTNPAEAGERLVRSLRHLATPRSQLRSRVRIASRPGPEAHVTVDLVLRGRGDRAASCSSSPRWSRRACSPRDWHGDGCGGGWRSARLPTRSPVLGHGRECGWKRAGCRWPSRLARHGRRRASDGRRPGRRLHAAAGARGERRRQQPSHASSRCALRRSPPRGRRPTRRTNRHASS